MASLIEELRRREAAARQEVDELRGGIAGLSERLARAEDRLSRLEITRETVAEILRRGRGRMRRQAEPTAGAADPALTGSRLPGGSPGGVGDGAAVAAPPHRRRNAGYIQHKSCYHVSALRTPGTPPASPRPASTPKRSRPGAAHIRIHPHRMRAFRSGRSPDHAARVLRHSGLAIRLWTWTLRYRIRAGEGRRCLVQMTRRRLRVQG
jgi:hypothetical protein